MRNPCADPPRAFLLRVDVGLAGEEIEVDKVYSLSVVYEVSQQGDSIDRRLHKNCAGNVHEKVAPR